jgi:GNAT superfamily N-acetyltransferase
MTSSSSIEYAFARTPVEYDEAVHFYRRALPAGERVIELMNWRRHHPQPAFAQLTFLARLEGTVVGAINVVPQPLIIGETVVNAAWHADSVVDSAFRGQGIGRELITQSADGYDVVLAKGTSPTMYGLRKSCGYRDVARSNYLVKVLAANRFGRSTKHHLYGLALRGIALKQRRRQPTSLRTQQLEEFGRDFDALSTSPRRRSEVRLAKDSTFLNWRYRACPGRNYVLVGLLGAGQTGAGVVNVELTHRMGPAPEYAAWIVDLICDDSQASVIVALIRECVAQCRAAGAGSVFTFATSERVRTCLRREGFVETQQTPQFTYRLGKQNVELERRLRDDLSWSFCHGDCDNELYD